MLANTSNRKDKFELIFHSWNTKIYAYAYKKTNSNYIAEETVQRVFIKLWKNLEDKKLEIDIKAQLFCITRTVLLDVIREENIRKFHLNENQEAIDCQTPNDIILLKELQSKISEVVDLLPNMRRQVFQLSRFDNLKHKEIATTLNISPKTVENHIRLALQTLKKNITIILFFFIY